MSPYFAFWGDDMSQVDEYELFADFIGREVNLERLAELKCQKAKGKNAYADCCEYILDVSEMISTNPDNRLLFMIYLYIFGNVMKGGRVIKRVSILPNGCLESSLESDLNPSELIVVENILRYIAEEEKEDE